MTDATEHPEKAPCRRELSVSVIVCTHNGAERLPTLLVALRRQRSGGFELIVVDDRSSDDSAQIAAQAGASVVQTEGAGGLAAARNRGVEASSGEIVAFTDDDCEPWLTWLTELTAPFSDPSVDGVAGLTEPASLRSTMFRYLKLRNPLAPLPSALLHSRNPLFRLRVYLRAGTGHTRAPASGAELYSVVGANMAFRRTLLDEMGGFDNRIIFGGEEEAFCRRAHERPTGARFTYAPAALIKHHYREGLSDTLRRARAYGRGNARQIADTPGAWPILYPFPLITATALAWALKRPRALPLAGALPLMLYLGWSAYAARHHDPEALLFAYIQLAQETATMIGEAEYALGRRQP